MGQKIGGALALLAAAALLAVTAGCQRPTAGAQQPAASAPREAEEKAEPVVRVLSPERKTVRHRIEQPGFNIEAFQETALHPRVSGYVKAWKADLGDRVRKGALLAELEAPEMVVAVSQKE